MPRSASLHCGDGDGSHLLGTPCRNLSYGIHHMRAITARFVCTLAVFILAVTAAPSHTQAADRTPALDYSLEDQFGATHTEEECRGAVAIYLGGDRKGSAMVPEWDPPLRRAFSPELKEGTVCAVGLAHLKGAPFFVKKKIIAGFPKDPEEWTLLDWKGHFMKTWGGEKDAVNIYVFDKRGTFLMQQSLHEFDRAVFDEIVGVIRSALDGGRIGRTIAAPQ